MSFPGPDAFSGRALEGFRLKSRFSIRRPGTASYRPPGHFDRGTFHPLRRPACEVWGGRDVADILRPTHEWGIRARLRARCRHREWDGMSGRAALGQVAACLSPPARRGWVGSHPAKPAGPILSGWCGLAGGRLGLCGCVGWRPGQASLGLASARAPATRTPQWGGEGWGPRGRPTQGQCHPLPAD